MNRLTLLLLLLATGCSSLELAPANIRQKSFTIETGTSKDESFNRIQLWAAKGGGQIRLSDRQAGKVVLKANVPCKTLNLGNGFGQNEVLWFTLELKAEEKKILAVFSNLEGTTIPAAWDSGLRPSNQQEVDKAAKDCLEPMISTL